MKGGVSKTTTAVSVAEVLADRPGSPGVLLVDSDPQSSASMWATEASDEGTPLMSTVVGLGKDMKRNIDDLASARHVVIDTPPGDASIISSAILSTQVVIVPASPRMADLHRLRPTIELAAVYGVPAIVLLCQTRTGTKSLVEARETLDELEYPVFTADVPLRESVAGVFGHSLSQDVLALYEPICTELLDVMEDLT